MINSFTINWILVILGFLLIAAELFVGVQTGFDLVLIGLSLLAGGIIGNWINLPWLSITVATFLIFLYVFAGRKLIKSKFIISTHKTNVDSLIGKTGIVIKEIDRDKKGKVVIDGEIWLATANSIIPVKRTVIVKSIEGVTLYVSKEGGEKSDN